MRIIFTLLMSAIFSNSFFAQISITANNVAVIGNNLTQAIDTLPGNSIQPGPAGNHNWNFTDLKAHQVLSLEFAPASASPFAADFPGANIAVFQGPVDVSFVSKTSAKMELLGAVSVVLDTANNPITLKLKLDNPQTLVEFPATYNGGFADVSAQNLVFPGSVFGVPFDSVRFSNRSERNTEIDGFGNLTTPLGTYEVIRFNTRVISHDTISIFFLGGWTPFSESTDTSNNFTWYTNSNGIGFPLAELNYSPSNNSVFGANWIQSIRVSNEEIKAQPIIKVFPNPAAEFVTVETLDVSPGEIDLYDFNGKKVWTEPAQTEKTTLSLANFVNGTYLLVLKDPAGGLLGFQKIVIQK